MKKILLVVAAFAIFSCKNEPEIDYVLLSGKIENPKGEKVSIFGNDFKKEISINSDGTFSDTLHIETSGYYNLAHGRERTSLYTKQGDELEVTLDASKFDETIKYSGKGSESNNYLASKFLNNEKLNVQEIFTKEEADFLKTINEQKNKAEDALTKVEGLSDEFISLEKKNINYEYLAYLNRYPSYHPYFAKKENFKVSEGFLAPLDKVDYDNTTDFGNSESYQQIVSNHYLEKYYTDTLKVESIKLIKGIKSQNIKNSLASELAYDISPSNKHIETIYNLIQEIADKDEIKEKVTEKYKKVQNLVAGKNSPAFDYENHKGGTTSLADLKGKYVYIDVWATWCGPCIGEIPSLKKVEKKYHNKNIEFVSISIDTPKAYDTWKNMVKDKELGGIQLMADNAWKSKFVTDYAIEGIPRFILIDPNGKIVNADAPRPSSPKLIELFDELKI
ncbi:TlpA disulfide reductase family protein [Kordia algicida OT-1]|uniref:Thioredoxin family protein n=1 Tax=Kordia algicida OT-1 TaxID=391587 RepID=A9E3Q8_9FLAO|nr:TlpA disulfide reductase family protein [Kordia algicida]EDP95255.1 thioredoxin family protein [Kordia algicida OT-1]